MKIVLRVILIVAVLIVLLALSGVFYVLPETEQAIITQFGRTVGEPVTEAGLHLKLPLVQEVNRIEERVLEWDGPSSEMPT